MIMNTYSGKTETNKWERGRCDGWTGGGNKEGRMNVIHLKPFNNHQVTEML
jgi:hypothetical protein